MGSILTRPLCPFRPDQVISGKRVTPVLSVPGSGPYRPGADCATGGSGPTRYSELSRQPAGVSQEMLTRTLRSLERDGIVTRTVTPAVPVTVTYEPTDLGLSSHHLMRAIRTRTRMDDVLVRRETYGSRAAR